MHTVRYTELSPERFKDFWEDSAPLQVCSEIPAHPAAQSTSGRSGMPSEYTTSAD